MKLSEETSQNKLILIRNKTENFILFIFSIKMPAKSYLIGADVSPSSHHCLGGLIYIHQSSQL